MLRGKNERNDTKLLWKSILHSEVLYDELEFNLSYAQKGMSILEPLCGSRGFLVPFLDWEYNISGIDLSAKMLAKLRQKAPDAKVFQEDISEFESTDKFDYPQLLQTTTRKIKLWEEAIGKSKTK